MENFSFILCITLIFGCFLSDFAHSSTVERRRILKERRHDKEDRDDRTEHFFGEEDFAKREFRFYLNSFTFPPTLSPVQTTTSPTVSTQPSTAPVQITSSPTVSTQPSTAPIPAPTPNPTVSQSPTTELTVSLAPSENPTVSTMPSLSPTISVMPSFTPSVSISPSEAPTISRPPTINPTVSSAPSFTCGNLTPEERRTQIMTILETVSVPTELQTTGSPQNLAAEWIIAQDSLKRCPDDEKFIQRYVMALLYFSTEGASWLTCGENGTCGNANYLGSSHECEWFGNSCDMDQCLTSINIELNGLAGTIPFELEQLTNLFELRLEQGTTASTIPSQLGNLSNLIFLDFDFNQLTGTIPETIYNLTQLEELDLNDNQLTGTLSTSAGNLVNLQLFQVQENLLTGTIPASLGNAQTMLVAEFYNNDFTGTMPDEVCQIPTIVGLTSDCSGSPPQIVCTCCTFCYA